MVAARPAAVHRRLQPSKVSLNSGGSVGLCYCPGKAVTRNSVKHERDLLQDLRQLKAQHGVTCVLCLLNTAELRVRANALCPATQLMLPASVPVLHMPDDTISLQSFGLREYEAGVMKAGLRLLTFPIVEMAAPVCLNATHTIIKQTAELVAQGHHVAVHCRFVYVVHSYLSQSMPACINYPTTPSYGNAWRHWAFLTLTQ